MHDIISRGDMFYIYKGSVCGSEQMAGRPAIIVSNDTGNQTSETVEVVYLTTRHKTVLPTHVTITSASKESTALCEQVTTVSVERLGDYCGRLTDEEMAAVDEAIRISLGLTEGQDQAKTDKNRRGGVALKWFSSSLLPLLNAMSTRSYIRISLTA